MADLALEIRGLGKHFGGQKALTGVDLTLQRGEIHALLGENGAGKSTLIKILAGAIRADEGEVYVGGRAMPQHRSPADAARQGLAFVHQDLGLVEDLSVAENVALEIGYESRSGLISFRRTEARVAELLAKVGVAVAPGAIVATLSQDQKVMVAVARALSQGASVIVLDEISSSLPAPEMRRLRESLLVSRRGGVAYLYVTHRLEEVFGLADRITVLRDGERVATAEAEGTSYDDVVTWIVGRAVDVPDRDPADGAAGPVRLEVRSLEGPDLDGAVSFEARAGEVLGICGLIGSGSRAVARLLAGAAAPSAGEVLLEGRPLPLGDPAGLARRGCAYVPGDRAGEGAVADMSVRENLFLTRLRGAGDRVFQTPGRERPRANALAERFDVRPPGALERPLASLSGGNQQKVIFARALRGNPKLLVLDDPTAGVDVGSRAELYGFLRDCAADGAAIVLASTDYEEVASQADRALVMSHGRISEEIGRNEMTADRLARASYRATPTHATGEVPS